VLKEVKIAVVRQSGRMGLTAGVAGSAWRRRRLLVLCYNGISLDDEHQWDPGLHMSPERFRERLELLRVGGYTVLGLADAVPLLLGGHLPPKAVSITFDDGMHDFYARAGCASAVGGQLPAVPDSRLHSAPVGVHRTGLGSLLSPDRPYHGRRAGGPWSVRRHLVLRS